MAELEPHGGDPDLPEVPGMKVYYSQHPKDAVKPWLVYWLRPIRVIWEDISPTDARGEVWHEWVPVGQYPWKKLAYKMAKKCMGAMG